ncbi:MAG: stage III sporulation protein AA, partial [Clostridia bacterium]|nr:stage III sporulation protein AA [Clostridia bacterium]
MLKSILPEDVYIAVKSLNIKGLREIRLRVDKPIIVNYGNNFYLGKNGLVDDEKNAFIISSQMLNDIVFKACECSIYAYNEEIKN